MILVLDVDLWSVIGGYSDHDTSGGCRSLECIRRIF